MKGVILAGGTGSRLMPCTKVTNKHLISVGHFPMIYHPLNTLIKSGIRDILVVTGKEHCGDFIELLGSGQEFGVDLTYRVQDGAGGIAQALGLAEDWSCGQNLMVILGDNIFHDTFANEVDTFDKGAVVFLKQVADAKRFGVPVFDNRGRLTVIEEKPEKPKTDFAVTGLYMYDPKVFEIIHTLLPSGRGELEITDVNNAYIAKRAMKHRFVGGGWCDAGTFESLEEANMLVKGWD